MSRGLKIRQPTPPEMLFVPERLKNANPALAYPAGAPKELVGAIEEEDADVGVIPLSLPLAP
jgi:hypothetical protein